MDLEVLVSFEIFVVVAFQFVVAAPVVVLASYDAEADAGYSAAKVGAQFREVAVGLGAVNMRQPT